MKYKLLAALFALASLIWYREQEEGPVASSSRPKIDMDHWGDDSWKPEAAYPAIADRTF